MLLQLLPEMCIFVHIEELYPQIRSFHTMSLSDTQVLIALVVALIPGVLAFRLATELYK